MNANYRKINDGSHNSSTYHKKDSKQDSLRSILKRDASKQIKDELK